MTVPRAAQALSREWEDSRAAGLGVTRGMPSPGSAAWRAAQGHPFLALPTKPAEPQPGCKLQRKQDSSNGAGARGAE